MIRGLLVSLALFSLSGCGNGNKGVVDWERMRDQRRGKPFAASPVFADSALMRLPPVGAVATTASLSAGRPNMTIELMLTGRELFTTYCAACHGVAGNGRSMVGSSMRLRHPPSLVDPPLDSLPADALVRVMAEGYGLMRSYASELSPRERWAVAAYVKALRLASRAELGSLPGRWRTRADSALASSTSRAGEREAR